MTAQAQALYDGDAATGSNATPGTSLGRAWQTLQKAGDTATPGSTVLVRGGTYPENLVVNVRGTLSQPTTFRAYRQEVVLLNGTGTSGSGAALLVVRDHRHLRFEQPRGLFSRLRLSPQPSS